VRPEKIGTNAHCPRCHQLISIAMDLCRPAQLSQRLPGNSDLPATEQQKDLARSLGCQFLDSITRCEISELIEIAEENQRAAQWSALDAKQNRDQISLAAATPRQIVDSLDDRGKCSVLITVSADRLESYENTDGLPLVIAASESMTSSDTAHFLMSVAVSLYKHMGLPTER
jgi:hypothetical protein